MNDEKKITAVKGFDANMRCRGYQFKIGESYTHEGTVLACESGFHSVEYPMDVFGYYAPASSVYAEVEASGSISRHNGDSKIASARLHVKAALTVPDLVSRAIKWVTDRCNPATSNHTTTDQSASSSTGDQSASSSTGDQSASSSTGYQSASSSTGYQSASSSTGHQSASSSTGYQSASLSTGPNSSSEIRPDASGNPLHAVAIATGYQSKARAPAGSAIVLVERNDDGEIVNIRATKIGKNGTKPDVWYVLKDNKFVEAAS